MGPHFVCRVNVCLKKRFTKFLNIRVCVLQANEGDIDVMTIYTATSL